MEDSYLRESDQEYPSIPMFPDNGGINIYVTAKTKTARDGNLSTTPKRKPTSSVPSRNTFGNNICHNTLLQNQFLTLDDSLSQNKREQSISTSSTTSSKIPNKVEALHQLNNFILTKHGEDSGNHTNNHIGSSCNFIDRYNILDDISALRLLTKRRLMEKKMLEPSELLLLQEIQGKRHSLDINERIKLDTYSVSNLMSSNVSNDILHMHQQHKYLERKAYQHLLNIHYYEWEKQKKISRALLHTHLCQQQVKDGTEYFIKDKDKPNKSTPLKNLSSRSSNNEKIKMILIQEPKDDDVLFGRGSTYLHPGNRRYYNRIGELREVYRSGSASLEDRTQITNQILRWIKDDCNGRFLVRDPRTKHQWYEVPDSKAMKKIRQALREHMYPHERSVLKQNNFSKLRDGSLGSSGRYVF